MVGMGQSGWVEDTLVATLLDLLAFLELSGADVVEPDAAVRQMEETAHRLRALASADRTRLVDLIVRCAAAEVVPERAAFFASVPQTLRLD